MVTFTADYLRNDACVLNTLLASSMESIEIVAIVMVALVVVIEGSRAQNGSLGCSVATHTS